MTALRRAPRAPSSGAADASPALRAIVVAGTVLAILALATLPLLPPAFTPPAHELARSAERLRLEPAEALALSDRSIEELLLGPRTFTLVGPDGADFYDDSERGHPRHARPRITACHQT